MVGGLNTMDRGSKYHEYGGRYTMVRGVKIPWVREIKIPWVSWSIYRWQGVKIPCEGGQNSMGKWVFIPFVGCQNTMDRGSIYMYHG